VSYSPKKLGFF
jgi:uncharacterized protein (DUF779 family)